MKDFWVKLFGLRSRPPVNSEALKDDSVAPDDPTEHPIPDPPKPRLDEWVEGKNYWSHRGYVAGDSHLDAEGNVRPELQAIDTHTEITYRYCQAGHLHEYQNDVLQVKYRRKKSKHAEYDHPYVINYSSDYGWTNKEVVETPYCD